MEKKKHKKSQKMAAGEGTHKSTPNQQHSAQTQHSQAYNFMNAQSYLDEMSRPPAKSNENSLIQMQSSNNS